MIGSSHTYGSMHYKVVQDAIYQTVINTDAARVLLLNATVKFTT